MIPTVRQNTMRTMRDEEQRVCVSIHVNSLIKFDKRTTGLANEIQQTLQLVGGVVMHAKFRAETNPIGRPHTIRFQGTTGGLNAAHNVFVGPIIRRHAQRPKVGIGVALIGSFQKVCPFPLM